MSAIVVNGSLGVLGGGERYTFALADVLAERHEVVIATWHEPPDRDELRRRGFPTNHEIRRISSESISRLSSGFDVLVQSRLAPPHYKSRAQRSILVVQFPARALASFRQPRAFIRQRGALNTFDTLVSYSKFSAEWLLERWRRSSLVIHPPVTLGEAGGTKRNTIVSIARFVPVKRHDVLIAAYRSLPDAVRSEWRLVLVGGADEKGSTQAYLRELEDAAAGFDIHLRCNASEDELREMLREASVFWHAMGYERPPDQPEAAEHFGIAVVEAMSYGAIPMVVDDGGPAEIVEGLGLTWRTIDDLVALTVSVTDDHSRRAALAEQVVERASAFSRAVFDERVRAELL